MKVVAVVVVVALAVGFVAVTEPICHLVVIVEVAGLLLYTRGMFASGGKTMDALDSLPVLGSRMAIGRQEHTRPNMARNGKIFHVDLRMAWFEMLQTLR